MRVEWWTHLMPSRYRVGVDSAVSALASWSKSAKIKIGVNV
jgi:hypothetical protein